MAEPTTSAGISLTVFAVVLLGPMVGPYALIALSALAGAMWPLSSAKLDGRVDGAWLLFRCTLMAILLTGFMSGIIERAWGIQVVESLGPVAFSIGALGNGWKPVFSALGDAMKAIIGRAGGLP